MLYPLPAPFKGATHVHFYEVLVAPSESIRLTGNLGTVDVEGVFTADPDLRQVTRTIGGREYAEGFRVRVNAQGAPGGNFRDADLGYWLGTWGLNDGSAWDAANPVAEPEPAPPGA